MLSFLYTDKRVRLTGSTIENSATSPQHGLLLCCTVGYFSRKLLRWSSHVRLLPYIGVVFIGADPLNCKVLLDILQTLVLIEPNLHATCALAIAFHPILIKLDLNDVSGARHLLHYRVVSVFGQTTELDFDNFGGGRVAWIWG